MMMNTVLGNSESNNHSQINRASIDLCGYTATKSRGTNNTVKATAQDLHYIISLRSGRVTGTKTVQGKENWKGPRNKNHAHVLQRTRHPSSQRRQERSPWGHKLVWVPNINVGSDMSGTQSNVGDKHSSTISSRFGFSNAAATRSLSFSCLFTATNNRFIHWKSEILRL